MTFIINWVRGNPTRFAAILMVVVGWLALLNMPDAIIAGLGTIVGIITAGPVWNAVTPVSKAVVAVEKAATEATKTAVETLTPATVGAAGELTGAGLAVAVQSAGTAVDTVLDGLGVKRRHRARKTPTAVVG